VSSDYSIKSASDLLENNIICYRCHMVGHYAKGCPFKLKKPTASANKKFEFGNFKKLVEEYGMFTNGMVNAILKEKLQARQVIQLIKLNDSPKMYRNEYAAKMLKDKLNQINQYYDHIMNWDATIYHTIKEKDELKEKEINNRIETKVKNKIIETNINEIVKNRIENLKDKISNETIPYERYDQYGKILTKGNRLKVQGEAGVRSKMNEELYEELGKLSLDDSKKLKKNNNYKRRNNNHRNNKNNKPPEPKETKCAQTQNELDIHDKLNKSQVIKDPFAKSNRQPIKIVSKKQGEYITEDGISIDSKTFNKYYYAVDN
jgi:hypothetical protein